MASIICIANQKGGVGKTTTAVNLGAALALAGHTTLLVDLDPQSSASSGVGASVPPGHASIYQVILGVSSSEEVVCPTVVPRLSILPSTRDLTGAEIELVPMMAREQRLAEALAPLSQNYEHVLIDCPPSLGLLTLNGLTAADSVLVPLQCEYYALEGLSALLETADLVRRRLNARLRIEGLLLTMFDSRNSLSHQVAGEVRKHFASLVLNTVIPRNVRLSEAPSHGLPAVTYDPESRGARAYRALASELVERISKRTGQDSDSAHQGRGG